MDIEGLSGGGRNAVCCKLNRTIAFRFQAKDFLCGGGMVNEIDLGMDGFVIPDWAEVKGIFLKTDGIAVAPEETVFIFRLA